MKPSVWPDYLDDYKAKSAKYGGETLAQHTWDVLARLSDLRQLRPDLPVLVGEGRLWFCLYWACLLHDFGKVARGFQARLQGGPSWPHRHEVLSLTFFDWIAPMLNPEEQRWIVAAIVSHHRDARTIDELYPDTIDPEPLAPLLAELDPAVIGKLWHWLDDCGSPWITRLGLAPSDIQPFTLLPHDDAVTLVRERGRERTRHWLRQYHQWVDDLDYPLSTGDVVLPLLLRGLTTTADHMASAHLRRMPSPIQEPWELLADRVLAPLRAKYLDTVFEPYAHQRASAEAHGQSAVLIAPTGSGKTEAALYWALGDGHKPVPRIFYALPYQASMNAMFDRLKDTEQGFGSEAVGLQHGRALQALYARLRDQEDDPRRAVNLARLAQNVNSLNARPVKVFSPYQMLKAAFQLRGFEGLLTDYAQGAFIFDEIHAYEPGRLALILSLVTYLREHFAARFFVMSATFPRLIREKLSTALGPHSTITASDAIFDQFQRHRLHLLDGELAVAGIARIVADVRAGKQVLVCANTVRRAQEIRRALWDGGLTQEETLLIHGRYTIKDRTEREMQISARCGVDLPLDQRQPFALIATQVVEVSLNIDLDVVYSDPAPLEALLQRFGRVNRQAKKAICPVYVFRQPTDGQGIYGRHKDPAKRGHIVRVTLNELARHDGQLIDEAAITDWLNAVYDEPQLRELWEEEYQRRWADSSRFLAGLRPFNSSAQGEEEFERLFDSVDVLPRCFEPIYLQHLANDEYIEASRYFVSISQQKYHQLLHNGLVRPAETSEGKKARGKWVVELEYDSDLGLLFESSGRDPDWD